MAGKSRDSLRKKYDFRWEVLDIIISGKSSIDSTQGFEINSHDEADRFLRSYGFDLDDPIERAEAHGNFHESVNFIRRYFLQPENPDGLKLEIPRKVQELTDVRELFLMASRRLPGQGEDTQGSLLRDWACSILKIMHTVAHIDQDLRSSYFVEIQKQIFDRFYKVIHRDGEERLYLGDKSEDSLRVNLVAFETKPKKSRDSTLIKLLHKPENVAEDIFDRVGLRFITETRLDALRVVKFLRDKMIVMPPNIKPSRSRNTLVALEDFRVQMNDLLLQADRGEIEEEVLVGRLDSAAHSPLVSPDNPHSSEFYRAIQFTCRQLIKVKNPLHQEIKELKSLARSRSADDPQAGPLLKVIERIDMKNIQREVRFFYPYEVQVVDMRSFEENERGRSAHSEYKKAQLQTALRRVMGALVDGVR